MKGINMPCGQISVMPILISCTGILCFIGIVAGCPPGTDEYYNYERHEHACCLDIVCKKGHQAMPCYKGNVSSSWCKKCGNDTFSSTSVSLKDRSRNKCRMRKSCHYFLLDGDETTDAVCYCPEKWHHLEDETMCLPNIACEKGFGQTDTGHCVRCIHGKTFSNKKSNSQRCTAVRNCRAEYRCTIRAANISTDAVCSKVVSDIDNCPSPGEVIPSPLTVPPAPSTPKTPLDDNGRKRTTPNPTKDAPSDGESGGKSDKSTTALETALGFITIFAVILSIMLIVMCIKKQQKELHKMHIAISDCLSDTVQSQRRELTDRVYLVIRRYLTEEAPMYWRRLGENLFGERFAAMVGELRKMRTDRDRMYAIVHDTWREECLSDGPNMKQLFDAMYSPDLYWRIPFSSLRERIISECDLPLPREQISWYARWYRQCTWRTGCLPRRCQSGSSITNGGSGTGHQPLPDSQETLLQIQYVPAVNDGLTVWDGLSRLPAPILP